MKIMVIGGGGREHTLGWALSKSDEVRDFYFVPGNGGTLSLGHNINNLENEDIIRFAKEKKIDLTVVGPEKPLVQGIVDKFREEGLPIFGPMKDAAKLEGSKAFAKELMAAANVPTASFEIFDEFRAAKNYVENKREPFVVKADGLAGGKGCFVCRHAKEGLRALEVLMEERKFGDSGKTVVIEDCLGGEEVSVLALISNDRILPFLPSQDHKRANDNDRGPNTGGMGAYAPVVFIGKDELTEIIENIFLPTIKELGRRGIEYKGVLYAGLMISKSGPKVLEFNVRFGDPESQAILPLLEDDLLELLLRTNDYNLPGKINWDRGWAVAVVLASNGYPGKYKKGFEIDIKDNSCVLFHAGTRLSDGILYTAGGRVLSVVGLGEDLITAKKKAYKCISKVKFSDMYYRKDIADKGIKYLEKGRL